jgi:hypothetical protein
MYRMSHDHAVGAELESLVDAGRLDELLARVTPVEIADAWRCFTERTSNSDGDPDWWAIAFWQDLAFKREAVARDGLLALIDAVPEELLGHVGAGPLEDFIRPDKSRIAWIEDQSRVSPRFRRALANVWVWGEQKEWVCERLEAAANVPLARPRPPFRGSRPKKQRRRD